MRRRWFSRYQDPLGLNCKLDKRAYKEAVKDILRYCGKAGKHAVIRARATTMFIYVNDPRRSAYNAALQSVEHITLHRVNCALHPNEICAVFAYNSTGPKYYRLTPRQQTLVSQALAPTRIRPIFMRDSSGNGRYAFRINEQAFCRSLGPH